MVGVEPPTLRHRNAGETQQFKGRQGQYRTQQGNQPGNAPRSVGPVMMRVSFSA